jgi:cyanate lyase
VFDVNPGSKLTQGLLSTKRAKGLSFADLERAIERDEVWIAALFYRQASVSPQEAEKLALLVRLFGQESSRLIAEMQRLVSESSRLAGEF